MSSRAPGQVIGIPGGSLAGASFAANAGVAKAGAAGERRTAAILDELARRPGGPSIIHDLNIPGSNANVDHVVISGRTVTVIDSKSWAGNIYWTLAGATYRGLKRFATLDKYKKVTYPAEKRTLSLARDRYAKYLGIPAHTIRLGLIIWPTGPTPLNITFFRAADRPTTVNGQTLTVNRAARLFGSKPADARLLVELAQLAK